MASPGSRNDWNWTIFPLRKVQAYASGASNSMPLFSPCFGLEDGDEAVAFTDDLLDLDQKPRVGLDPPSRGAANPFVTTVGVSDVVGQLLVLVDGVGSRKDISMTSPPLPCTIASARVSIQLGARDAVRREIERRRSKDYEPDPDEFPKEDSVGGLVWRGPQGQHPHISRGPDPMPPPCRAMS